MAWQGPLYKILTASNWTELGLPGSLRAFESQYFLGGQRTGGRSGEGNWVMRNRETPKRQDAIKPGKPVWKPGSETPPPNYRRKGKLFFSNSFKLDKRHDCTQINGEWYCVYSPDEWKKYRQSLKDFHKKNLEMMQAGTTYNINSGKTETREEVAQGQKAMNEKLNPARKAWAEKNDKVEPEKPPTPSASEEVALKIKDAQRLLLENMGALVAFNGVAKEKNPLKAVSSYIGDPSAFTNLLTSPTAGASSGFVHATPAALGLLIPKLRFFYVTTDPTMVDPHKREVTEEIVFPDHTLGSQVIALSKARAGAVGDSAAKDILKSRATEGTDVGIKDFNWVYDNKSSGENVLKAELTIHFGSAADMINDKYLAFLFTSGKKPTPTDARLAGKVPGKPDLSVSQTMQNLQREIGMRKLMMATRGNLEETGEAEIKDKNLAFTSIKVLVGWARPEGTHFPTGVDDDFLSALEATQRLITLNLFTYKLDFRQEGQVDLKLSFGGSIGHLLADTKRSDVLSVGAAAKALQKKPVDVPLFLGATKSDSDSTPPRSLAESGRVMLNGYVYKAIQKSGNILRLTKEQNMGTVLGYQSIDEPVVPLSLEGIEYEITTNQKIRQVAAMLNKKRPVVAGEPSYDENKRKIEGYIKQGQTLQLLREYVESATRKTKYAGFLTRLFAKKRLFVAGLERISPFRAATSKQGTIRLDGHPQQQFRFIPYAPTGAAERTARQMMNAVKRFQTAATETKDKEEKKPSSTQVGFLDPEVVIDAYSDVVWSVGSLNRVNLYYMRLGDIIDAAFEAGVSRKDYGVVLGSITPSQLGVPATTAENFSLADIPISIEYFGQWFLQTIVQAERTHIGFREFTRGLLRDLVEPVLAAKLQSGQTSLSNIKFDITVARTSRKIVPGKVYREDELRAISKSPPNNPFAPSYQYWLIGTPVSPRRNGDRTEDEAAGIYHLLLGTDRGLVKSWSFSEKKIPYMKAMTIVSANYSKALVLPQDVTLTMVGNTLFQNGQLVYINADMGLGTMVARELKLGGYYRVVKSENTITPEKYETRLTCFFEMAPWDLFG